MNDSRGTVGWPDGPLRTDENGNRAVRKTPASLRTGFHRAVAGGGPGALRAHGRWEARYYMAPGAISRHAWFEGANHVRSAMHAGASFKGWFTRCSLGKLGATRCGRIG
jgi:hypothetical protein